MTVAQLSTAAKRVLEIVSIYSNGPKREMHVDPALFAYLDGRFGHMSRQLRIRIGSGERPKRIDFRFGGRSPAVIEFVVRPPIGGAQLFGSQNFSELNKLTRIPPSRAQRRFLLLMDLSKNPIARDRLKPTFDAIGTGPGRFRRHSVRVIYVHAAHEYNFLWSPSPFTSNKRLQQTVNE